MCAGTADTLSVNAYDDAIRELCKLNSHGIDHSEFVDAPGGLLLRFYPFS